MGEGSRAGAADGEQDSMSVSTRLSVRLLRCSICDSSTPTSDNEAISSPFQLSQFPLGCSPQASFCTAYRGGDTFFLSLWCGEWCILSSSTVIPPEFYAHSIFSTCSTAQLLIFFQRTYLVHTSCFPSIANERP
jgi:hypothetical protein